MRHEDSIPVPNSNVTLEAEFYLPDSNAPVNSNANPVILCHPHPLYGGDMHNNVVSALFQAFERRQYPVLRFNFRGTGESTGAHSGGMGEVEDVKAAVTFFLHSSRSTHALIAGYSYGAAAGGVAAAELTSVIAYAAIAMPFDLFPEHARRMNCLKPKLFVQGTEDTVATYSSFKKHVQNFDKPFEIEEIHGADHFFRRESPVIAELVTNYAEKAGKMK